ncbi:MAG: uracil-DNA glycosylase [Patescibacteria group bacterium]|mgnify:FL=1
MDNRTELLRKIKDEVVGLKKSPLYKERVKNNVFPVIGEGSHYAKIMFVGEAPGRNEAKTGRPFCGAAGKILDELLASVGIDRKDVYITNIVKDRPPFNRDPLPEEIEIYGPFLDRQIEIIQPEVIATLGRFSMDYIIKKFGLESQLKSISQMHGKVFNAGASYGNIKIVPLYHPAVAIYNKTTKDILIKDFQVLKDFK